LNKYNICGLRNFEDTKGYTESANRRKDNTMNTHKKTNKMTYNGLQITTEKTKD